MHGETRELMVGQKSSRVTTKVLCYTIVINIVITDNVLPSLTAPYLPLICTPEGPMK